MTDGPERRPLLSPEFARRERKRSLRAALFGLGMGAVILVMGVGSVRSGEWIKFGRIGDSVELPGWIVVLMALFILGISGAIFWRSRKI